MPRPASLDPLFRSLRSFKGVGPQLGALLNRFFGGEGQDAIALDLLMHMPVGSVDRRRMEGIARTFVGHIATLKLHIDRHIAPPRGGKQPHRVFAHDETGEVQLVYFGNHGGWVEKQLPVGEERYVSGTIGFFQGMKQISHPDYVVEVDRLDSVPLVEPVYPLTQGLSLKALNKLILGVLASLPDLPEWIPESRLAQFRWPGFSEAMRAVHAPTDPDAVAPQSVPRSRLAYDEYFAGQLALLIVRSTLISPRGIARKFSERDRVPRRSRPALHAHRRPEACDRHHPRRPRRPNADVASPPGRRGLRQDRRCPDGYGGRCRKRRPVGAHVAHRIARRPALPHDQAARRSRGARGRAAHRKAQHRRTTSRASRDR